MFNAIFNNISVISRRVLGVTISTIRSLCQSHKPERQGGKAITSVLKSFSWIYTSLNLDSRTTYWFNKFVIILFCIISFNISFNKHIPVWFISFSANGNIELFCKQNRFQVSRDYTKDAFSTCSFSNWRYVVLIHDQNHTEVKIRRSIQLYFQQYLSYHPTEPYAVGTQRNRLIDTILLSTHIIGLDGKIMIL